MIAVIGAGPAGLALAWRLTRAGHDVVVLEADDRVGGTSGSRTISGQRVDLGVHRLTPRMPPEVRTAVDELVELQEQPRRDRIRFGQRWVPYPMTAVGSLRSLPASTSARVALDAVTARWRSPRADTYAEVVRADVGPTMWDAVHEPLARKLWDADPALLSGELARGRVGGWSAGESTATYLYPRRGFGALCEAMAELVPDVRLQTKVTGLIEHDDRVIVGLADGRIVTATHVFSTLPAGITATWLGRAEPARVHVPVRAVVLVHLTVAGRPYTPFDVHHLPDRTVLATRISEPGNFRTSATDPADRTVLCAEIPCWPDDAVWRASTAALGQRVADDLVRSGLPDPVVSAVDVVRLPAALPVMTPAALAALDRAEEAMASSRRVTVLGRHGLLAPDDTARQLELGFAAAERFSRSGS